MSKIALLFYGCKPLECLKKAKPYVNKDLTIEKWKENVIKSNSCDVFIHCWSPDYEETCIENYKPKKYIFENKKKFPSRKTKIVDYGNTIDEINKSHLYSMKTVIELKNEYEKEENFTYDVVMIARMDIMWFNEINLQNIKDLNKIYISPWNYANDKTKVREYLPAPYDGFFISNSTNINCFIELYNNIDSYVKYNNSHFIKYYFFQEIGLQDKIDYMFYRFHDFVLLRWLFVPKSEFYVNGQIGDEWTGWLEQREKLLNSLL